MHIKRPRRILILGATDCGALDIIRDLTGSTPQPDPSHPDSIAGLTHEWDLKTAYYSAKIPIWVDEVSDANSWRDEFLKPEAKEVVEAVGGWIYCFRGPVDEEGKKRVDATMEALLSVINIHASDEQEDVAKLCVETSHAGDTSSQNAEATADWEDMCFGHGFEYIDYKAKGKNEYGENVGFERLKEALEANEWSSGQSSSEAGAEALGSFDLDDVEDDIGDFSLEETAMTAELFGMKAALLGEDDWGPEAEDTASPADQARQVDSLDQMMSKLLAVKEQSADLPDAQKKRMAAQAVRELMKQTEGEG